MFFGKNKKQETDNDGSDIRLIMECLQRYMDGDYSEVDVTGFKNQELGQKYNEMLAVVMDKNNRMTVRLNDAMSRIGDSQPIKDMLEQVNSQTEAIGDMRGSSKILGDTIGNIQDFATGISDSSHDIIISSKNCIDSMKKCLSRVDESSDAINSIAAEMVNFKDKVKKINEIIDQVRDLAEDSSLLGINASIEAARAGEAGRGFAVVAEQVNQLSNNTASCADVVVEHVEELIEGIENLVGSVDRTIVTLKEGNDSVHDSIDTIEGMNSRLTFINDDINKINEEIRHQSSVTQQFVSGIENIADSYETLSAECLGIGKRFFRISRDIDGARGDMFRKLSKPTLIDTIKVYEMDHLIFTWRVYNHMAGFEVLKIEQLNNPKGCKVGKWFAQQTDPVIVNSAGFKQAVESHELLHRLATESFEFVASGEKEKALEKFYAAVEAFESFREGLHMLIDHLKENGMGEETPVWQYVGV